MIHVMVLHCYLFQNIRRPQPAITNRYIDFTRAFFVSDKENPSKD